MVPKQANFFKEKSNCIDCTLVTGASSGIGLATSRALSEAGADICLIDQHAGYCQRDKGVTVIKFF